ncbi:MAG: dynamin family protein [Pyrinomonadaceae bacterium]|nr:dynamin family protein [Pyrinomonadaceae bacterium]
MDKPNAPNAGGQIVDEQLRPLIESEKLLLKQLHELAIAGGHTEDARRLSDILAGVDELFLLVIVGEFNAGKSSFINALFGHKTRVEGPVPVDDRITIMRYGEQTEDQTISAFVTESRAPIEFLRDIAIVDTPGTNSVIRQHQEITEDFIPRADLVLFITSIDRPLTESERQFLSYIQHWGKKIVIVLNKIDTKDDAEIAEVTQFVDDKCRELLGFKPLIFPVAAKLALSAKLGSHPRDWSRSRFEALEDYIFHTLSEGERLRLKLLSPLDSANTVADKLSAEYGSKLELLADDSTKIARIEDQLQTARTEMQSNFQKFILQVDGHVIELRDRGIDFLDRHMRVRHLNLLRSESQFREAFEREVLAAWQRELDQTLNESVDWLVRNNMRLWNDTLEYFNTQVRKTEYDSQVVGRVGGQFVYEREEVHARIRREAEARVSSLDHREECRRVINSALGALQQSFGLGAGAVGLGYVLATIFTTVALDVTGIAAATVLFAASFFILPYKRRRATEEFRAKTEALRGELRRAFETESNREIDRAVDNVRGALEPYTRFVRGERAKIEERSSILVNTRERLLVLKREIESVVAADSKASMRS